MKATLEVARWILEAATERGCPMSSTWQWHTTERISRPPGQGNAPHGPRDKTMAGDGQ